jgi:hypothetical protein
VLATMFPPVGDEVTRLRHPDPPHELPKARKCPETARLPIMGPLIFHCLRSSEALISFENDGGI